MACFFLTLINQQRLISRWNVADIPLKDCTAQLIMLKDMGTIIRQGKLPLASDYANRRQWSNKQWPVGVQLHTRPSIATLTCWKINTRRQMGGRHGNIASEVDSPIQVQQLQLAEAEARLAQYQLAVWVLPFLQCVSIATLRWIKLYI